MNRLVAFIIVASVLVAAAKKYKTQNTHIYFGTHHQQSLANSSLQFHCLYQNLR
jgi:hypothetical protein